MAYFPNGSAGEVFHEQCGRCRYGEGACPVYEAQYAYNYKACNNEVASEILGLLVKNDGTCTVFEMAKDFFDLERVPPSAADAAYYALTPDTPKTIRELVLKASGRVA